MNFAEITEAERELLHRWGHEPTETNLLAMRLSLEFAKGLYYDPQWVTRYAREAARLKDQTPLARFKALTVWVRNNPLKGK